jgi:hypothetical protein
MFFVIVFAIIVAFLIITFWQVILVSLIALFGGSAMLIGKTFNEIRKYRINFHALKGTIKAIIKLLFIIIFWLIVMGFLVGVIILI